MNNRPVEQALATLLPTHAQDIPQELLSLAVSLVAQSRSFSSSLKPDEEIARPFACAEIACKRLTRALKLPPLLGHPPCPPRVYKKLYSFLDRSLTPSISSPKRLGTASAPGTPSRSGSVPLTPTRQSRVTGTTPSKIIGTPRGLENTPSKPTPLKKATTSTDVPSSSSRTPQRTIKFPQNGISAATKIPDAPEWTMVSIRTVCKTLSTPAPRMSTWSRPPVSRTLPPHIFAGVSSILYFISNASATFDEETTEFLEPVIATKDKDADDDFIEIINTLIVAIYFLVLARRRQPTESSHDESRKMDKKTFSEMRQTALMSLGLPSTERRYREDVDQWIALIMEHTWASGKEWFENIPQAGELDGDDEYLSEHGEEENGGARSNKRQKTDRGAFLSRDSARRGLLPGLGTMMQDRVDWLNAERREDYAAWKADIIARIEQIEAAAGA
ncbi:hypothetical protein ARAM_007326 [Aspergillus rambellii]|uniref:ORC6 first cyclin-like domain-containing protein n=1 Tax=Aspergillus rambellii TaxID=308745 RepID=A0A0F8UXE2_9EURO|nr:hypothetical protein ARAM_007326 [Aspergillus rambellii]